MAIQSFEYRSAASGLNDISLIVPNSDTYIVQVSATNPGKISSALVMAVKVNGSTKYTSPTASKGFTVEVACSAGDTITIHPTSSSANDSALNAVKIITSVSQGSAL